MTYFSIAMLWINMFVFVLAFIVNPLYTRYIYNEKCRDRYDCRELRKVVVITSLAAWIIVTIFMGIEAL